MSQQHDVLVIGGGQAALAIGHHLAAAGRSFLILEAAEHVGGAWRERWDSLRLFTPARHDGLPGMPFPGDPDHYPTRDEVVAYLEAYVERFALPVRLGARVARVSERDPGYAVALADGSVLTAAQVVVATGPFQTPRTPGFAAGLSPAVLQLHSTEYRSPERLPEGPVLVVGGGNTGFQIAEELAATHEVHLAVGARQTPVPQRLLGRDIFTYFTRLGLMSRTVDSRLGRRMRDRETLVGSSPRTARRAGVRVHGRATGVAHDQVLLAGDEVVAPRTVIWATGFTRDYGFVDVPVLDEAGLPVHTRGVTAAPGLYFLGMPWQHTRGSALLGFVKDDAAFIAAKIADATVDPHPIPATTRTA